MLLKKIGAMILAAGSASRMGQPKQLIEVDGITLARRAVESAISAGCAPVVVVTGAHHEKVSSTFNDSQAKVVLNPNWEQGMGTSLRAGLAGLLADDHNLKAVVVLLCDQPHMSADVVRDLVKLFETSGKPIAACEYAKTLGPPCCFGQSTFAMLQNIGPAQGAKSLLMADVSQVARLSWEPGQVDLDTQENLKEFRSKQRGDAGRRA